ncbi:MAG: 16S rRNA (uracil(1498)-N(3))-methyltransferase [Deltaproteobacteria bacterium]|nr:16S rRNA (uracil(1498)-N(3))-methyltransferase [Deltaproteobacteria bacterium]
MRRFYIEEINPEKGLCVIPEKEAKHMLKVLRMRQGDRFVLMDGKGNRFDAEIGDISHHKVTARLISELPKPSSSPVNITIFQAMIKPRMMDYMIEKTSELGVSHIIPFYSERTVIRINDNNSSNKTRHWKEIARSASKQSGRPRPAEIAEPVQLSDLIKTISNTHGMKIVLWEGENNTDLRKLLKAEEPSADFTAIIGPEGGFAKKEIEQLKDSNVIPVSLGSRILRAETAAIALTTIIQYEWGDLGI